MNDSMTVRNAVVFGGDGFLGSHLVEGLAPLVKSVRVFGRFPAGVTRNLENARDSIELVHGDFAQAADVERAVTGCDTVFHFLSATTPASSAADPGLEDRGNVAPTKALLEACVRQGVHQLVYASSGGAVYGEIEGDMITEDHPTRPISPYGRGKLEIEKALEEHRRLYGLRSLVLRYANPYGSRQRLRRGQGVIPLLLDKMARGEPVTVYGSGSSVRDYVFVEDAISMTLGLVRAFFSPEGAGLPATYNVGSGVGVSTSELIDAIEALTGTKAVRHNAPARPTDVSRVVLDTSRARLVLGGFACLPLHEGLKRTIPSLFLE